MKNNPDILLLKRLLEKYYEVSISEKEMVQLISILKSESLPKEYLADKNLILPLHAMKSESKEREKSRQQSMESLKRLQRKSRFSKALKIASLSCAACVACIVVLLWVSNSEKNIQPTKTPMLAESHSEGVINLKDTLINPTEINMIIDTVVSPEYPRYIVKTEVERMAVADYLPADSIQIQDFVLRQNMVDEETAEMVATIFESIEEDYKVAKTLMDEIDNSFSFSSRLYIDDPVSQSVTPIISI